MDPPAPPPDRTPASPPRAFTQGVGTVFQFVGVMLFLVSMFVCCGSGLVSKNVAQRHDLMQVGWGFYTAQQAISVSMTVAVFFGLALAGIGLGLQAQNRLSPYAAVAVCGFATAFWAIHVVFFAQKVNSLVLPLLGLALFAVFATLAVLSAGALREMRRDPPPVGHEILPPDYKVPYSHLHEDPPEVRLARELEQRRERLAVQQKELEMLEGRLRRKLADGEAGGSGGGSGET